MKYKYVSTQYNMSILNDATTSAAKIGQLDKGVTGYGDEIITLANGDKWIKILTGGTAVGWVAVIHLGVVYGVVESVSVVVPPASEIPAYFDLTTPDGIVTRYIRQ